MRLVPGSPAAPYLGMVVALLKLVGGFFEHLCKSLQRRVEIVDGHAAAGWFRSFRWCTGKATKSEG